MKVQDVRGASGGDFGILALILVPWVIGIAAAKGPLFTVAAFLVPPFAWVVAAIELLEILKCSPS